MLSTRDPPQMQRHIQTEMKGWKKIFHANRDQKKQEEQYLYQIKQTVNQAVKRDKGHNIMIKGSIQEDKTIINIYAHNIGALQYVRQMLTSMKGEINNNTIVGDFNTPLTPMELKLNQQGNTNFK